MAPRSARSTPSPRPRKVAFYSHDTQGLGHIRRNIAVASAIAEAFPNTDTLLLSGNPEATQLPLPAHTDIVTLPTITKEPSGRYRSRSLASPLDLVVRVRSAVLGAALTSFRPDLLIVDKLPLGLGNELLPALHALRQESRTQIVLGLRDILDDPQTTAREWASSSASEAIDNYYDAVWVYGDPTIYDPVLKYEFTPSVAAKVVHTGYLGTGRDRGIRRRPSAPSCPPGQPYVLCMVGGGQDGYALGETFVSSPMPAGYLGVLLTGPFMSSRKRASLRARADGNSQIQLLEFIPNAEDFLDGAAAVVSMAGYNSVCESLTRDAPLLLVPRTTPRSEQLIRAERLAELGLVDVLRPSELSAPRVSAWLAAAVLGVVSRRGEIDLDGLERIPALVSQMLRRLDHAA